MEPLTPEQARARHASGEQYTAVASPKEGAAPEVRVEMQLEDGYVVVVFMDEYGRDAIVYEFTLIDGSLFLESASVYGYGSSQERGGYADAESVETYEFTTEGVVQRMVEEGGEGTTESRYGIDVSKNWEPVPEFGEYASLIRRDR
ncbi:hypothetical protein [Streptomyces thermocarboxydovorans]